jgi:DNA-binding Lrp family transcriptional regulator
MQLKPQDTVLVLKYWSLKQDKLDSSVRDIAESIGISPSEVSKGTRRLVAARLVVERDARVFAESGALLEWLGYGVRYAYPQESVGYGRGMATSWNCPVLKSEMVAPTPAFVWPVSRGDAEGALIKPFHESVPVAASKDERLYQILSLLEAIRGGKPRELAIARNILADLIKGKM